MIPVSMVTAVGPGDYLSVILRCWGNPSLHNLLGFGQSPRKSFCGTRKFRVKMAIFYVFWVIFINPKNLGQCEMKKYDIDKIPIGEGMLVQNVQANGLKSSSADPFIFENVIKMS